MQKKLICSEKVIDKIMKDQSFDFNPHWVRNPSVGGNTFKLNDVEVKEIVGIIIYSHNSNSYWKNSYNIRNESPPDCSSVDGLTSSSGMPCGSCEYNQFGSSQNGMGKGKACRNSKKIYIIRKESPITPCIISIPPTSLNAFAEYRKNLMCREISCHEVVTRISLQKSDFGSSFVFEMVEELATEDKATSMKFSYYIDAQLKSYIQSLFPKKIQSPQLGYLSENAPICKIENPPVDSEENQEEFWKEIERESDLPY